MEEALSLVDKLVVAVGRAFYSDNTVVVLDILLRESYLCHEEIAPRLKLSAKDVQKVLNQLESEMLIRSEDVQMEDMRNSKCYYIDYQLFVNVVRFRVYHMLEQVKVHDGNSNQNLHFECPTCRSSWTELEVQRCVSKDHKFVCSNCCPSENISSILSEAYFTLVPVDHKSKLANMLSRESKLKTQLNQSDLHDGIFDLLTQLKNVSLPHNRPSTNMKCGNSSSTIMSAETLKAIEESSSKYRSTIPARKLPGGDTETLNHSASINKDALGRKFVIDFNTNTAEDHLPKIAKLDNSYTNTTSISRSSELPEFLLNSHVKGAMEVMDNVSQLQQQRLLAAQAQTSTDSSVQLVTKSNLLLESTDVVEDEVENVNWE